MRLQKRPRASAAHAQQRAFVLKLLGVQIRGKINLKIYTSGFTVLPREQEYSL